MSWTLWPLVSCPVEGSIGAAAVPPVPVSPTTRHAQAEGRRRARHLVEAVGPGNCPGQAGSRGSRGGGRGGEEQRGDQGATGSCDEQTVAKGEHAPPDRVALTLHSRRGRQRADDLNAVQTVSGGREGPHERLCNGRAAPAGLRDRLSHFGRR
jgi:hypothetical protein